MEKEIEIRSDEVQEILTEVPNWMIRYGITLIFAIILSVLVLSWFIKYPETIEGSVELTTEQPPITLVAKTSGYIQNIMFSEDDTIKAEQVLAELANPVNKQTIDSLKSFLKSFDLDSAGAKSKQLSRLKSLGQAQAQVNQLYNRLVEYDELVNDDSFLRTIRNLDEQVVYNPRLAKISGEQLELFVQEMKSAKEKYKSDSVLYANGVIAKITYFTNQSEYFAKKQTLLNAQKAAIQYKVTASDFAEEKNKLLKTREDMKRGLIIEIQSAIRSLYSFADEWKLNYILVSPIDGKLAYLSNLTDNEFVSTEQPLFAVVPHNEHVLGVVQIEQQGYGKIEVGQEVRMKLNNFPYQEYGQLKGRVDNISKIAGASGYILKVRLDQGLSTTYNKEIDYKPGMTGTAEIVTEDLRLIERIFYSIRKIFDR